MSLALGLPGWRKAKKWKAKIKSAVRECERTARGGGANKAERTVQSARNLLAIAYDIEAKVHASMKTLEDCTLSPLQAVKWLEIGYYHDMLIKHIDLIERRLIQGETIPHEEKVFSLFEPHTELIKKGKQMPPVEFGHRLLICTDQNELNGCKSPFSPDKTGIFWFSRANISVLLGFFHQSWDNEVGLMLATNKLNPTYVTTAIGS